MKKNLLQASEKRRLKTIAKRVIDWYTHKNKRTFPWRETTTPPYKQVMVEFLLRRTRASAVAVIYDEFFQRFPDWENLCKASVAEIEKNIISLGLWQRRAKPLKDMACEMHKREGRFPSDRAEIKSLPSVGDYVASAIELFVHQRPRPLLDVNMARILGRYFAHDVPVDLRRDTWLHAMARELVECSQDPMRINWGMIDLAATICVKSKPRCHDCPLSRGCRKYGVTVI